MLIIILPHHHLVVLMCPTAVFAKTLSDGYQQAAILPTQVLKN